MPGFVENWVEDTARNRIVRDESIIQSEWPAHSGAACASGFLEPTVGSGSILLAVPSSRWFKPRTLWITNDNPNINKVNLYVGGPGGSCSATIGGIWIAGQETQFVALDGVTVGGADIYCSALLSSLQVRIAGLLLKSGPE